MRIASPKEDKITREKGEHKISITESKGAKIVLGRRSSEPNHMPIENQLGEKKKRGKDGANSGRTWGRQSPMTKNLKRVYKNHSKVRKVLIVEDFSRPKK